MKLKKGELVAIIRGIAPTDVLYICEALMDGGITHLEVSLSNPEIGLACLGSIHKEFGNSLVLGAGTVTNWQDGEQALEAGSQYLITPAWDANLAKACISRKIPIFPGVFSPSEIMEALQMGLVQLKLFPASCLGPGYIKSLLGPFPKVEFIGVGGIGLENLTAFYQAGCHAFALGSELVPRNATKDQKEEITQKTKQYLNLLQELSV